MGGECLDYAKITTIWPFLGERSENAKLGQLWTRSGSSGSKDGSNPLLSFVFKSSTLFSDAYDTSVPQLGPVKYSGSKLDSRVFLYFCIYLFIFLFIFDFVFSFIFILYFILAPGEFLFMKALPPLILFFTGILKKNLIRIYTCLYVHDCIGSYVCPYEAFALVKNVRLKGFWAKMLGRNFIWKLKRSCVKRV